MFSTPESARISDTWVSVQVLGGNDLDEAGAAFMGRFGVTGFPTLLAVTASGDLLNGDLLGGKPLDADGVFSELAKAQKANDAFQVERARLQKAGDASSLRELAMLNLERRNPQEARALLEKAVAASPDADGYLELTAVLSILGDREAERQALDVMITEFKDHEGHIAWRMRRATMHVEAPEDASGHEKALAALAESLEGLRKEVAAEGSVENEGTVRLQLAGLLTNMGDAEGGQAHVDWVLEKAKDTPLELDALLFLAAASFKKDQDEDAQKHAAAVLEKTQTGPQAARAHELLGDIAFRGHQFETMAEHYKAVIELAPGSPAARGVQGALDWYERRKARNR